MRVICIFLCSLILGCSNSSTDETKPLCSECPENNSGHYQIETINNFIHNELIGVLKVDSTFKSHFLKCSNTEITNEFEWSYLSVDKDRNYYHLIGAGDYSTELWVVATDKNNEIDYCFLGASSGGDSGDGYETYSEIKGETLREHKVITSIFMDSQMNEFTDSLKTDSIYHKYKIDGKGLILLKSNSTSTVSKWENN